MKILITGGAGYIGTVLVEKLLAETDHSIVVLDNLLYRQDGIMPLLANPRVRFVYGDVRNFELLQKLMDDADYIIPLAAITGMPACNKDPKLAEDVNHGQLSYIANEAHYEARIIFPNTNSGYGVMENGAPCNEESPLNPLSVYGKTKCAGEKAIMQRHGVVTLRLATVFGTSYRFRTDLLVNNFVLKLELCEAIKRHLPDFVIKQDEFSQDLDKRDYIVLNDKIEATGWRPLYSLDDGIKELIAAYPVLLKSHTKFTNL